MTVWIIVAIVATTGVGMVVVGWMLKNRNY